MLLNLNGVVYPRTLAWLLRNLRFRETRTERERDQRYQMGNRRKVATETIENKQCRLVSFSKRRKGLFKKAEDLHKLNGSHIALLVLSEAGVPYFHGSHSVVDKFLLDDTTSSSSTVHCLADDDDHHHHQAVPQSSTGSTTGATPDQNDVKGSEVGPWRVWMSNVEINEANCEKVDDLMALKNSLEGLKERVASKIAAISMQEIEFFENFLV